MAVAGPLVFRGGGGGGGGVDFNVTNSPLERSGPACMMAAIAQIRRLGEVWDRGGWIFSI